MSSEFKRSSRSVEWYTPAEWIERVRAALGGWIELDPASCEIANRTVRADRIYTKDDDGLSKPWDAAKIFTNPPGGKVGNKSVSRMFIEKAEQEFKLGGREIIILAFNSEQLRWATPTAVAFTRNRIKFVGAGNSPVNANAFLLYTHNPETVERFCNEFSSTCLVLHGD